MAVSYAFSTGINGQLVLQANAQNLRAARQAVFNLSMDSLIGRILMNA